MNKDKVLSLKPYSSIVISSLKEADGLLEKILSSEHELQPRKINKHIILYGAGELGKMAKFFFDYLNIPFLYVVDRNASQYKSDEYWQNTEIIHPDDVKEMDKKDCLLVVCIVTIPIMKLQDELKNNGWKDIAFFYDISETYRDQYPLSNGWFLGKFNEKEKEFIRKVFYSLADDISRAYYVQFLAWRKLRIELLFDDLEINKDNRFFIPEVTDTLKDSEVFVDCGAHYGSVIQKFINIVKNKYKEVYAFEPDEENFKKLSVEFKNIPKIKIIKNALGNKIRKDKFYQGFDYASQINKGGNDIVDTITLDSLNMKATFIKMHLEGGEFDALKGAVNTIQKYRPLIAVTIYHNSDGAWKIPLFLMSNLRNYKYHIRLHSYGGTGVVFYSIPEERIKN